MRRQVESHFGFLRTTLLGGVVFLLPLAVVGYLLGQGVQIAWSVISSIKSTLEGSEDATIAAVTHLDSWTYALLVAASFVILIGACFFAGMIARRSLGRWFSDRAERYLLMLFPRYAVFKDQLTGNLGGGSLRPVLAQIGPSTRVGMEVERDDAGRVAVYLPSSPDPWSGTVEIVSEQNVTPIDAEYIDVMTAFEQLGRGVCGYAARAGEAGRERSGE